jgi:hypothetical protein
MYIQGLWQREGGRGSAGAKFYKHGDTHSLCPLYSTYLMGRPNCALSIRDEKVIVQRIGLKSDIITQREHLTLTHQKRKAQELKMTA